MLSIVTADHLPREGNGHHLTLTLHTWNPCERRVLTITRSIYVGDMPFYHPGHLDDFYDMTEVNHVFTRLIWKPKWEKDRFVIYTNVSIRGVVFTMRFDSYDTMTDPRALYCALNPHLPPVLSDLVWKALTPIPQGEVVARLKNHDRLLPDFEEKLEAYEARLSRKTKRTRETLEEAEADEREYGQQLKKFRHASG